MPISFDPDWQTVSEAFIEEGETITVPLPSGSPGDILVAFVAQENGANGFPSADVGWSLLDELIPVEDSVCGAFWKVREVGESDPEFFFDPALGFWVNVAAFVGNFPSGTVVELTSDDDIMGLTFDVPGTQGNPTAVIVFAALINDDLVVTPPDAADWVEAYEVILQDDGVTTNSKLCAFAYESAANPEPVFTVSDTGGFVGRSVYGIFRAARWALGKVKMGSGPWA